MRFVSTFFALAIMASAAFGANDDENSLVHDWRQENDPGEVRFISNYKAPVAFSQTGEPEAVLTMHASKITGDIRLSKIVEREVKGIRQGFEIGEYIEEGSHKPERGISSYVEDINGHKVAFIKYRVVGIKGKGQIMPRSVIHAILLKNAKVYTVSLIVIFAGHEDEVRADQIRLIKGILRS